MRVIVGAREVVLLVLKGFIPLAVVVGSVFNVIGVNLRGGLADTEAVVAGAEVIRTEFFEGDEFNVIGADFNVNLLGIQFKVVGAEFVWATVADEGMTMKVCCEPPGANNADVLVSLRGCIEPMWADPRAWFCLCCAILSWE